MQGCGSSPSLSLSSSLSASLWIGVVVYLLTIVRTVVALGRLHRILVEDIDVEVTREDRSIVDLAFTLTGHYPNTLAGDTRVGRVAWRDRLFCLTPLPLHC